jgi:drug/metabolite transporter (DMT)-like permease
LKLLTTKHPALATFGLLFGAVAWGILWYPYRLLDEAGISGVAASVVTYGMALLMASWLFRGNWRTVFVHPSTMLPLMLVAGWTNLSYVLAVIGGEVMRVLLLFYLSPLWTLLLAKLLLEEHTGRRGLFVIALSLAGAFVMLWQPAQGLPIPQNGYEWIALSSGFCFALTNVLTRRAAHLSLEAKSFAIWSGVAVLALALLPFSGASLPSPSQVTGSQWLLMLMLGTVLLMVTLLVQYGITHTPVTRASVIFLFELVVAAISSYLLAGEEMTAREWIGGTMIVAATIFAPKDGS